jgi:hypothetical protein
VSGAAVHEVVAARDEDGCRLGSTICALQKMSVFVVFGRMTWPAPVGPAVASQTSYTK